KPAAESAAQYLPSLIIKRIAYYVSTDASVQFDADAAADAKSTAALNNKSTVGSSQDRITRASQPLAAVCRSWRVAVLPMFYSHFVLDVNSTAVQIAPYRRMVYEKCDIISNN
ncbi:hypothetical protein GGI22_007610, partial [Coemansia erecta]